MFKWFLAWRRAKVRGIGVHSGDTYIRFTPNFGFGVPWFRRGFRSNGKPRRLRFALHHGFQMTEWRGGRWVVVKQMLGKSKVRKEAIFLDRDRK